MKYIDNKLYISSVTDCLNIIDELSETYTNNVFIENPVSTKFLYRGISNIDYNLSPGIFRKDITSNEKYTTWAKERAILKDFISEACSHIGNVSTYSNLNWLETAQHYGVPTRLLDWTSNPLVALYFACEKEKGNDAAIWMLHKNNYYRYLWNNKFKTKVTVDDIADMAMKSEQIKGMPIYPIVYKPYYRDHRMSAQSSYFMIWGSNEDSFEDMVGDGHNMIYDPPNDNERSYSETQRYHFMIKVHIYSDAKRSILRQLDMCGINAKTLFPGLDGIGRYMERKYRFDYDEA